ncbi:MAG: hypothetical protein DI598_05135 [Pseudopedobacter saltans]|uniref:Outer membrane transport energization protein TonB n=1 Tax=Pseudopedobacter saltans TaxID=151895 RepID=A0A2W5F743_9SPHI|nr:MAG: hypothetical protein DI598_05135 [Pseudopedobacter saltans]
MYKNLKTYVLINSISNTHINNNTNAKALGLTALTCLLLVLLFIFIRWQNSIAPNPATIDDGGVEVNFGNSDQGMGDIPPMVQGDPAPEAQESTPTPEAATPTHAEEEDTHKEVAANNDADATAIKTSPKPKKAERPTEKPVEKKKVVKTTTTPPVTTPKHNTTAQNTSIAKTPKPEAPKAVYKGGNGKGGNGADSYNGVSSQGVAGGRGDQGKMGGNPNSDSYNGSGQGTGGSGSGKGSSGVQVISGLSGRRFAGFPSFEDSFNENARVSVDISVDASGHVTSASINPRGTTTTNSNIRSIALRRARQLKFNAGSADSQTGTVSFNFRLKG